MIGIGAIVKAIGRILDNTAAAAERGLKLALGDRQGKPTPILIPVEPGRRRRR